MRNLLLLTSLLLISGCTSISTKVATLSGNRPSEFRSIYIIYDDFVKRNNPIWSSNPDTATSADVALKKIGRQNLSLWPQQFLKQGIQVEFTTTGSQKQIPNFSIVLIDAPQSDLDYDMLITLESVSPRWFGMYDVNFEATLRDRKIRTGEILWQANIELHKGLGEIDERALSEKLANELITQLKGNSIGDRPRFLN